MSEIAGKRCLVTGATGVVGVPLVRELCEREHEIKILARGAVPPEIARRRVQIVRGDLSDDRALKTAVADVDWVFHLAARLHVNNAGEELRGEYEQTNVTATARLLELAAQTNAQKFIFFSTINVYGASRDGETFDETSRLNPSSLYAETKAAAEESVLRATNGSGARIGVVLRLAAVYGSRMKGNYVRLLDAVRRRRFFFIGAGANRRTLIHQQDAARAAILAAENQTTGGRIYNVTDGEIHTLKEIVRAVCRATERKTPKLHLPAAPVRVGVGLAEDFGRILRLKTPVSRLLLEKFLEDTAVSGAKIKRELGFEPQFDLNRGWREAIEI